MNLRGLTLQKWPILLRPGEGAKRRANLWTSTISPRSIRQWTRATGPIRYGFNIIGVHGQPLVSFAFDTQEEAEAAHKGMQPIIAMAKLIVSHPPPYPR